MPNQRIFKNILINGILGIILCGLFSPFSKADNKVNTQGIDSTLIIDAGNANTAGCVQLTEEERDRANASFTMRLGQESEQTIYLFCLDENQGKETEDLKDYDIASLLAEGSLVPDLCIYAGGSNPPPGGGTVPGAVIGHGGGEFMLDFTQ